VNDSPAWIDATGTKAIWYGSGYWIIGSADSIGVLSGWRFSTDTYRDCPTDVQDWGGDTPVVMACQASRGFKSMNRDAAAGNCRYFVGLGESGSEFESMGLTISDNSDNSETFCGTSIPDTLTRSGPVEITFSSNSNNGYAGFELDFSCGGAPPPTTAPPPTEPPTSAPTTPYPPPIFCGGDFFPPSGTIQSPGWPESYPPNHLCIYNITCYDGAAPKLNVMWGDVTNAIGWSPNTAGCGDGKQQFTHMVEPGCPPLDFTNPGFDRRLTLDEMMKWGTDRQDFYSPGALSFGSSGLVVFQSPPMGMGGMGGPGFEIEYECPPLCVDKKSQNFCNKKVTRGKCHKKKVKRNCAKTCGHC